MYVLIFIRDPKRRTNFPRCSQARDKGCLSRWLRSGMALLTSAVSLLT